MMPETARILLAEDDALVRETLAAIIEHAGHQVTVAADGQEAWSTLQAGDFDLVISDIRMPRMGGFELFERMQQSASLATVPVIFLSALASEADVRQGMVLGASDYLTKPADPAELCRVVKTRLAQRTRLQGLLEERSLALTRYVPHELRTPLNGVMGYAELMLLTHDEGRGLTREETRDFGQQILVSGKRLLRIADNLMLLLQLSEKGSRFPVGKDLHAWALASRRQVQEIATEYGRRDDLVCSIEDGDLPVSSELLVAALVQLTDNAFKFSAPGLRVDVIGRRDQDDYLFEIRDSGRGMSEEQIARQGPFVQHDRAKYEQQGLGLGLEIVRQICARYALGFKLTANPDGTGLITEIRIPHTYLP
jgi:two-component system, sensor histidine kinase and response regulator